MMMSAKNKTVYCQSCGAKMESDWLFCEVCGQRILEEDTAPDNQVTDSSRRAASTRSTSYHRQHIAWALIFGVVLIPVVFLIIWLDVGEMTAEVGYSLLGFVVVTAVLGFFTLRKAGDSWQGVLEEMIEKENGIAFVFRSNQGKRVTIYGGAQMAEYFSPGDRVIKIKGYDYPEKVNRDGENQLCMVCGKVYPIGEKRFRFCRYPSIDPHNFI